MDQLLDWVYGQTVGFLGDFFARMGSMGVDLFDMSWVKAVILFFSYLAWALYGTGLVVAMFETGIDYESGRGGIRSTALNAVKGFLAVSLFTTVPVELFKLSVELQAKLSAGITGYGSGAGELATSIVTKLKGGGSLADAAKAGIFGGLGSSDSSLMLLLIVFMMGYAVVKVFFSNLKRGGILLIQISVGSLYMFNVPRGYLDGFIQWCRQVIALCLTTFLQSTMLVAGLMVLQDQCLLGIGLMLAAGEVPRIAGTFGLETSAKSNLASAVNTAQTAVNITRTVAQVAAM